jgi:hypothetical protein
MIPFFPTGTRNTFIIELANKTNSCSRILSFFLSSKALVFSDAFTGVFRNAGTCNDLGRVLGVRVIVIQVSGFFYTTFHA